MKPLYRRNVGLSLVIAAIAATVMLLLRGETPRGTFTGTIKTAESGAGIPGKLVTLARHPYGHQYRAETDEDGRFVFRNVAAGTYTLMADTRAHHQPSEKIIIREGQVASAVFELKPMDPFLRVFDNQQVFTTKETPRLRLQGFVPLNEITVRTYALAPEVAIRSWRGWLPGALHTEGKDLAKMDLDQVSGLSLVQATTVPVRRRDVEGVFREDVPMGTLRPGMYLAAIGAGPVRALSVVTVTDLCVIVKASAGQALVWAVRMDTGEAVPGAEIRLMREGRELTSGQTGADGLAEFDTNALGGGNMEVVAEAGGSLAMASIWREQNPSAGRTLVYTYTDRPVYRPGHRVHFKSILRTLDGDAYTVPQVGSAIVNVSDGQGNLVYKGDRPVNAYGSLSGEFDLSESAIPGLYTITIDVNGVRSEETFSVAEYRKPEFEVKITPDRKRYTGRQTIKAVVQAGYYYGAPVPDGNVNWYVMRSPAWYYGESDPWDEDLEEGAVEGMEGEYGEGELVKEGRGRLDENGRLQIVFTPPEEPRNLRSYAMAGDWSYTIHANVTDASERGEEGQGSVLVTQGDFRVVAESEDGVAEPGVPVSVSIEAMDYDGKPVPNVSGEAVLNRVSWEGREERMEVVSRQNWQADNSGRASVSVTPDDSGDYRVSITAKDSSGNTIRSTAWIWVMDEEYASFPYPYEDMEVKADKRLYREGETAEILVNTKFAPQTALLSLEGAGIVERRFVRLEQKSTLLKVPVTDRMMPAVRANLCFFRDKQFVSGDALINVSRDRKALKVEITPDKPKYFPGETAVYRVRTLDPDGEPVAAEVSLGVVDEAVYAVRRDMTTPIARFFYPKRLYEVQTAFSFPQVYLSGDDKAGAKIQTRKFFPDTAFWDPSTVTNADGRATFEIKMPDSLTTWRATCRAATLDTRVGQSTQEVVVNKPFLVRLEAPRFFTQGDSVTIAAVAHNLTDESLSTEIGIKAGGMTIDGRASERGKVGPGETRRVEWTVAANQVGDAPIRVWGRAWKYSDAMELTLPVIPRGRQRIDSHTGALTAREDAGFDVRSDAIPGTPRLTVRLSPSLAGTLLGSLEYLAQYPYGCVEQTMSSFLPDIVIHRMMTDLGVGSQELKAKLPKMVESGLLKLYDLQGEQGWGWWRYDEPDPWMTAYVVFGLQEAREAGFPVSDGAMARGRQGLLNVASNQKTGAPDTRAFVAYVLARAGESRMARHVLGQFGDPVRARKLTGWGRAMQALALAQVGDSVNSRRVLEQAWTKAGSGPGFSEGDTWRSETEVNAAILWAAMQLTPNDPRIPSLVSRIMRQRRGDHWSSTRDTAFVLLAMSRYLRASDELQPDMDARVLVNGKEVARRRFTRADIFEPEHEVALDSAALGTGHLVVSVVKTGRGRLYYAATMEQVAAGDLNVPVRSSGGLVVERVYRPVSPPRVGQLDQNPKAAPPRTTFNNGDTIEVNLTVRAERAFDYVMVEDMLPAGCEVRDRGRMERWEWSNWWAEQVIRDEKMGFAIRHLEPGVRQLTYRMVAQTPGRFTALPPQAYDMYNPATRGEGVATGLTVR